MKKILYFMWQLPQNLVGLAYLAYTKMRGDYLCASGTTNLPVGDSLKDDDVVVVLKKSLGSVSSATMCLSRWWRRTTTRHSNMNLDIMFSLSCAVSSTSSALDCRASHGLGYAGSASLGINHTTRSIPRSRRTNWQELIVDK